jgi:hypothetical protein
VAIAVTGLLVASALAGLGGADPATAAAAPSCHDLSLTTTAPGAPRDNGDGTRSVVLVNAGPATVTLPVGVGSVVLDVCGAWGQFSGDNPGGRGGRMRGTVSTNPAQAQTFVLVAGGRDGSPGGGGAGPGASGAGGGYSAVFTDAPAQATALVVAGGGGGASASGEGGSGGGTAGFAGNQTGTGGGGGTRAAGGSGGRGILTAEGGQPGGALRGGDGGTSTAGGSGGGGGGGWYGGGGGGAAPSVAAGGPGGGGAGYLSPSLTDVYIETDGHLGEGAVVVTYVQPLAPRFEGMLSGTAQVGTSYDATVRVAAVPDASVTLAPDSALPPGLVFAADPDGTAQLAGTPTQVGTYDFTLVAKNAAGQASQAERVVVAAAPAPATATPTATTPATGAPAEPAPTPSSSTASPTPDATQSPPPEPSPSAAGGDCATTLSLIDPTVTATGGARGIVRGRANGVVELSAYTRPSTVYSVVRRIALDGAGRGDFRIVPPRNTRMFAQEPGCVATPSVVVNVRTRLSLDVSRQGVRTYTFSGNAIPARPGGLIVSLYRITASGEHVLTAQTRANAAPGQPGYDPSRQPGSYLMRRVFTGSGRFGYVLRTGQDMQSAPGVSATRSLLVF